MQLVETIQASKSSGERIKGSVSIRKRKGRIIHSSEQLLEIKELFDENREIYERCKREGKSSHADRIRHMEIRQELLRLRAI